MGENMKKKWKVKFNVACELTMKQIWPDGDAPENPTSQDVIDVMQLDQHTPAELIREWNLDRNALLVVIGDGMQPAAWKT